MAVAIETSFGQQCDSNGVPLSGGTITVYDAGTTTSRSLYSDTGLSVSATNPITLDSSGRHDMRYISATAYKYVVKDSSGSTIYTRDNVDPGVPIGSGALAIANGGTGATDAATALVNLGAATAAQITTLSEEVAEIAGSIGSTGSTQIATGTTAQRPSSDLAEGMIRRNTTTHRTEGYNDQGQWENYLTDTEIGSQSDMETGTSTTKVVAVGRQHFHQSAAKAWAHIAHGSGSPSISLGYGVTSVSSGGTGVYNITLTTAMSSANYIVVAQRYSPINAIGEVTVSGKTTTGFTLTSKRITGQTDAAPTNENADVMFVVYGDI